MSVVIFTIVYSQDIRCWCGSFRPLLTAPLGVAPVFAGNDLNNYVRFVFSISDAPFLPCRRPERRSRRLWLEVACVMTRSSISQAFSGAFAAISGIAGVQGTAVPCCIAAPTATVSRDSVSLHE
jgi:hypothetical protein